ncbi:tRNA pseudouridine(55) synthase TruB [Rathayibacter rathayi]|uniref:tRNA pseudouridine synthase B n=1 Tax=Rathayibacter rathayi TaxID=33887 RepID=A0ABD6WCM2_RATRA|nr:tRNA pseudouridine(55) synthase TruB [Rathayibacter rathayi]AZZ49141.1 tRNA pseudouridine(55) synthase TruB [Rathayibacter rathayi]MWV73198.1 tRNA pseudouridine(55) synthase TruB [Rathayibacter rathayi NCPPB 2980 = VKM Ac-1601]PPF16290.1 tRNA pseudouridine(55) synthase TruB [Rathayibacter rathayi]PPF51864.1 tRNA pseudouridine(55) synthase TruB [Rathayibacter rathayi]PPF83470.1 tRNA pseudouridine(55) synthase TruB [Rathayibacter rathayi]
MLETPAPAPNGILLLDKPGGITSHDLVSRTRRRAGTRKVGHAGTLDPMATGLMILGLGPSTRLLTYLVGLDKQYEATIRLGASTSTDDREGELLTSADSDLVAALTPEAVADGVAALTGAIEQVPSTVSAIKVDGRRAYARARDGEEVILASRPVTVSTFDLLGSRRVATRDGEARLDLDVRVTCSSGTYIRALARDLGAALAVGGHLRSLRRTVVGPFSVAQAGEIDELDVPAALLSPTQVAGELFPLLRLDAQEAGDLANGKRIPAPEAVAGAKGLFAAVGPGERLIGLAERHGTQLKSVVNFPTEDLRTVAS